MIILLTSEIIELAKENPSDFNGVGTFLYFIAILATLINLFQKIFEFIKDSNFTKKQANPDKEKYSNTLENLFFPLYFFVEDKKSFKNYTPNDAKIFLIKIEAIRYKNLIFSTEILDNLINKLKKHLWEDHGDYISDLYTLRNYIIYEYFKLKNILGYAPSTKKEKKNYLSSPSSKLFTYGIYSSYISFILFALTYFLNPLIKYIGTGTTLIIDVALIIFSFVFLLLCILSWTFSLLCLIYRIIRSKKKWDNYSSDNHK